MGVEALAQVSTSFSLCPRAHGFLRLLRRIQRLLLVLVLLCPRLRRFLGSCGGSCAATHDGGLSARPLRGFPCDCFLRPGVGGVLDDNVVSVVFNPSFG